MTNLLWENIKGIASLVHIFLIKVMWFCVALSSLFAAFVLVVGLSESESAVQEAAIGSIGSAIAVVPYVLARSVMFIRDEHGKSLRETNRLLSVRVKPVKPDLRHRGEK